MEEPKKTEEKTPFFSIVVPCYNCKKTLPRLLDNLRSQFFRDFEIILVDDCSTEEWFDESWYFRAIQTDPIVERHTKKNSGPGVARQVGLDVATGSYVLFIDSDDMLASPLTLGQIVQGLRSHNFPDILSTSFYEVHDEGVNVRDASSIGWVHGKIYKREYLQKNDIRFPDWRRTEDGAFNYVAFSLTGNITYANELDTYLWIARPDSLVHGEDYTLNMIPEYAAGHERAYNLLKPKGCGGLDDFAIRGAIYVYLYDQATKTRRTDPRSVRRNERAAAKMLKNMDVPAHINKLSKFDDWVNKLAIPIEKQMASMRNQEPGLVLSEAFPAWVSRLTRRKVRTTWEGVKK